MSLLLLVLSSIGRREQARAPVGVIGQGRIEIVPDLKRLERLQLAERSLRHDSSVFLDVVSVGGSGHGLLPYVPPSGRVVLTYLLHQLGPYHL